MTRKALGRGLGALLSSEGIGTQAQGADEVRLDLIDPGALQPRNVFDESKLDELAKSISANGVVQPVLLRRKGDRFELIAGERRWRAAERAGLTKIPAVVRDIADDKVLEIALIENIQREDLNPIEEARAYKKLIETLGLTQETVAIRVGRDRSYVTNYLRLLRLPEDIQDLLQSGRISTGHARTLLGASHADSQRRIARKIIEQDLSVRATERLVKTAEMATSQPRSQVAPGSLVTDPNVRAAESRLRRYFGTKVRIVKSTSAPAGRIEFEFYDDDDLTRLFGLLISSDTQSAAVRSTTTR